MRLRSWLGPIVLYLAAVAGADFLLFDRIPRRQGPGWWLLFVVVLGFALAVPAIAERLYREAGNLPLEPRARRTLVLWLEAAMLTVLLVTAANLLVALQGRPDWAETLLVVGFFWLLWRLRRWIP